MSIDVRRNHEFTMPLRALFALVAIATLLGNAPWQQPDQWTAITAYAGSIMWGVMAAFGNKAGWQRRLTLVVAIAYLVLVVGKLLGIPG
jgi:hypothetical protein